MSVTIVRVRKKHKDGKIKSTQGNSSVVCVYAHACLFLSFFVFCMTISSSRW